VQTPKLLIITHEKVVQSHSELVD